MTNKAITLDRAVAKRLVSAIEHGALFRPDDLEALRAAIADPVPPAGCSPESQKYKLLAMARNYRHGHSWDQRDGEVVSKAADEITRLQAELERVTLERNEALNNQNNMFKKMCDLALAQRDALQSELTKALELLNQWDSMWNGGGIHNGPLTKLRGATKGLLSNQSAPADKGRGDLQGGWVTISKDVKSFLPAGVDRVSMMGVTIHGDGSQNPVTQTMNGVIVNLDGYTLYAPGAKPADKDDPALIKTLHANGDLIALQATVAQQAQRIADLEADKGQDEPVAWLAQALGKNGEVYRVTASPKEITLRDVNFAWGSSVIDRFTIVIKPLYAEQPAPVAVVMPKLEMAQVVRAHTEIPGCPVLTSNQCHALAMMLNACLDEVVRLNGVKS